MQQNFQIPSVESTQQKAVVDGVLERVLQMTGIEREQIIFTDPHWNTAHQAGATLGEQTEVKYTGDNLITVSVEEERDEMERIARGVNLYVERKVFLDKDIQVSIAPVRTRYNVTVSLRRVSQSRDLLLKWTNNFNTILDMGQRSFITEAESYYYLPKNAIWVLWECWKASEVRVPRFEKFRDFLNNGLDDSVTELTDIAGTTNKAIAFRANHTRIEVVLDAMEPEWIEEEGVYHAEFVIRFVYQRPEEVRVNYPYIINQTALPDVLLPQIEPPFWSNEELVERSEYQRDLDGLAYFDRDIEWVRLPYSLLPKEQLERTHYPLKQWEVDVFASDVVFAEDNMVNPLVFRTEDLAYAWDPEIVRYLEHCRIIDPTGQSCIIRMRLFGEGAIVDPKRYEWKNGNEFWVNTNINVKHHYFVVESAIRDWRKLDLYPLHLYPKAAILLLRWLHPKFDIPKDWEDQDKLKPGDMDDIEDHIKETDGLEDNHIFFTVAHTSILTFRRD